MKTSLQKDVDRGLAIVAEMAALKEELEAIGERLGKAAQEGPQIPLEDAERDGMQYLAAGTKEIVPVVLTADCLRGSFQHDSKIHREIEIAATVRAADESTASRLPLFYRAVRSWEALYDDGKIFRRKAREVFSAAQAERFIAACVARDKHGVPKSAIKIEWKRARARGEESR